MSARSEADGRIRVLYVIVTLEVGGAQTQLLELAAGLDRRRFDPLVYCLSGGAPLAGEFASAGVRTVAANFFSGRSQRPGAAGRGPARLAQNGVQALASWGRLPATFGRFVRQIRAFRPHVLHGMLFHGYVLGTMGGVMARVPVIVASRLSLSMFKDARPHYRAAERLVTRWTDLVVANSEAVRRDTIATERIAPERVAMIYNGVHAGLAGVDRAAVRRELGACDGPVAIVVANFLETKGHPFFLEAWAAVCRDFSRAQAWLVGDGPLRQACEARVRALGLDQRVRLLGTRRDVPRLLAAADLLVHPSLEEGFANAILEAMAAGRPVVATAVGGNGEAVVDGATGLLVPARDSQALATAIRRILRDADLGRAMGAAGQTRVRAQFGMQTMVERYEAAYEGLVGAHVSERR